MLQIYTISAETEIWWQMLGTAAWRTKLKGEMGFPKEQEEWKKPGTQLGDPRPGDSREMLMPLGQVLLPVTQLQQHTPPPGQVSEQIYHASSWNSHCTGPLQFSSASWERAGRGNSIKQEDIKNDRWEKGKQLVPRPILTSVNCRRRRLAQISSGISDTLILLVIQATGGEPIRSGAGRAGSYLGGCGHWKGASVRYFNKPLHARKMYCLDLSA